MVVLVKYVTASKKVNVLVELDVVSVMKLAIAMVVVIVVLMKVEHQEFVINFNVVNAPVVILADSLMKLHQVVDFRMDILIYSR